MWDTRHLTNLQASTACYGDGFTLFYMSGVKLNLRPTVSGPVCLYMNFKKKAALSFLSWCVCCSESQDMFKSRQDGTRRRKSSKFVYYRFEFGEVSGSILDLDSSNRKRGFCGFFHVRRVNIPIRGISQNTANTSSYIPANSSFSDIRLSEAAQLNTHRLWRPLGPKEFVTASNTFPEARSITLIGRNSNPKKPIVAQAAGNS
jgi:hypothetical protein